MRPSAFFAASALVLAAVGCGTIRHELPYHMSNVHMTPPPLGTPPQNMLHFEIPSSAVYLLDSFKVWPRSLERDIREANPHGYPIYNLKINDYFGFGDFIIMIVGEILGEGALSSRSKMVEGDLLLPYAPMAAPYPMGVY